MIYEFDEMPLVWHGQAYGALLLDGEASIDYRAVERRRDNGGKYTEIVNWWVDQFRFTGYIEKSRFQTEKTVIVVDKTSDPELFALLSKALEKHAGDIIEDRAIDEYEQDENDEAWEYSGECA